MAIPPSFAHGLRVALPLAVAVIPFGLVYGLAVAESPAVSPWVGAAGSWLILAGASQLSLLSLIEGDAAWPVGVGTALVINARFALYSTALAPAFVAFPARWRFGLPYLMTDQVATLSLARFDDDPDPRSRRWFYLGAGVLFCGLWWVGTVVGVVAGNAIPESLDFGFAVPATFLALLVPTLRSRPALATAVASAAATVAASPLPSGTNILVGAFTGIGAGWLLLRRSA